MSGKDSDWESSKGLARAILHDRGMRRKWLARLMMFTVGWMALGLWVLDGFLADDIWRFAAWWGICGVLACVLLIFALYDALAVIREEKEKSVERMAKVVRDQKDANDE